MTTQPDTLDTPPPLAADRAAGDSLAVGLLFMLLLTVAQRLVGFGRSIAFCSMLQDDQLGRWSLAFSFLLLAAPLAVLALPGTFGRYVEYYRQRDQLGVFLRRTVLASLSLAVVVVVALYCTAEYSAWLVFGDSSQAPLVRQLSVALTCVILFNFIAELLTALRELRVVAMMRFVCSLLFAALGILLLTFTTMGESAVIIAFGAASLVTSVVAIGPLIRVGRQAVACRTPLPHRALWQKLLPFAAWIWLTDLLANLFDAADRFMIVHFAHLDRLTADSLVGQYHASRIVPFLLVSLAGIVAATVLPYMSHDWERGMRGAVRRTQLLTLKLGGLAFTVLGSAILLSAPIVFGWLLGGKYDQGRSILPWTVTYCVWFSLLTLVQNYLWCAEKARLGTLSLLLGLALNIGLNLVLLPRWGLAGAVCATTVANGAALALVLGFAVRHGLPLDRGALVCGLLPASLLLGGSVSLLAVLLVTFIGLRRGWLLAPAEQQELADTAARFSHWVPFGCRSGAAPVVDELG